MGVVLVLTPVVISSWPAITAAVAGAASTLGLAVKESIKEKAAQKQNQEQKEAVQPRAALLRPLLPLALGQLSQSHR